MAIRDLAPFVGTWAVEATWPEGAYEMGFDGTTWTLERSTADFTPLDFQLDYLRLT